MARLYVLNPLGEVTDIGRIKCFNNTLSGPGFGLSTQGSEQGT